MARTSAPPSRAPLLTGDEVRAYWARRAQTKKAPPLAASRDWYRIERAEADQAEIYIFDVIGWDVTAADFVEEIRALSVPKLVVHINSPGGFAWDGIAMYTALVDHPAEIETRNDGLAASAASIIFMAGDHRVASRHSMFMIHSASGLVWGNAEDMRKEAAILDKLDEAIAGIYADKADGDPAAWLARMREESWYSDREAVDAGLADEVAGDSDDGEAENRLSRFDLSMFTTPPPVGAATRRAAPAENHHAEHDRAYADLLLQEIGLTIASARR